MHRLRSAQTLARLVLVWFVLSLGVAVASPVVNPQAMELVCSGSGGIKVLVKTDDGAKPLGSHTLDCPLCASAGTPPPLAHTPAGPAPLLTHVLRPAAATHLAWRTAAPLPARGPPVFS